MPSSYYVWRDGSLGLALHFSVDIIARLGLDALEAYKSVPRRGREIGGLLLGNREIRGDGLAIFIADFESVESEYRTGPSYKLSDVDLARLDAAVGAHHDVVGVYRTQTRSESLTLERDDAVLLARYFREGEGVFVLLRPASTEAAVFLSHRGEVREFAFSAAELPIEFITETGRAAAPVQVPPPVAGPKRWWPLAVMTVAAAALIAATAMVLLPARQAAPVAAKAVPPSTARMGLEARRLGRSLEIRWDRKAEPVRSATHAVLEISDGSHLTQLELNPEQLASGLFLYWPQSPEIGFRMDVFSRGTKSSETVRVIDPSAVQPVPAAEEVASVAPAQDYARPSPFETPRTPKPSKRPLRPVRAATAAPAVTPTPQTRSTSTPAKAAPAAIARAEAPPSPPPPLTAVGTAERREMPKAPEPVAHSRAPSFKSRAEISVEAEPVRGSRLGRAVGRIPLLRRFRKKPEAFVAPVPLRQVRPTLTELESAAVTRTVPVDVKVYVAESGKVEFAELMSSARHPELASAAVYAARKWSFTPARLGDEIVPGEVILHFTFSPAQVAAASR